MWSLIAFVGVAVMAVGIVGLVRPMAALYVPTRGRAALPVLIGFVGLPVGALQDQATKNPRPQDTAEAPPQATPTAAPTPAPTQDARPITQK